MPTRRSQPAFVHAFDALGQRKYLTVPTGARITYAYDVASRITCVINPEGDRNSKSYDAFDRLAFKYPVVAMVSNAE